MQILSHLFPKTLILAEARESSLDRSDSYTGAPQTASSQNVTPGRVQSTSYTQPSPHYPALDPARSSM